MRNATPILPGTAAAMLPPRLTPRAAGMTGQLSEPSATATAPPVLRSEDLLRGMREIVILHAGEAYRLRVTSNDRLILTK